MRRRRVRSGRPLGRVLLVGLAVAWGTLSMTLLLGVGGAMQTAVESTVDAGGADWLRVSSGTTSLPWNGLPPGRRVRLDPGDAARIERALGDRLVRRAAVEYGRSGVTARDHDGARLSVRVRGVGPGWCELRGFGPRAGDGRPLQTADHLERRRVAVLGREVATRLFGDRTPVGETFEMAGRPFVVVGIRDGQPPMSNYDGMDRTKVIIPATTFAELFGARHPNMLLVGLRNRTDGEATEAALRRLLGSTHDHDPRDDRALTIRDKTVLDRRILGLTGGSRWLIGIVGVLGLLAAMVGVGNVMFVLADERRSEFALLSALGASPAKLLRTQILEAVQVTLVGGGVGMLSAAGLFALLDSLELSLDVRAYLGYPTLSLPVALGTTAGLGLTGLLAGLQPARRAARTDPAVLLADG